MNKIKNISDLIKIKGGQSLYRYLKDNHPDILYKQFPKNDILNKNLVIETAKKFKNIYEFRTNYKKMYQHAVKYKYLKEIKKFLPNKSRTSKYSEKQISKLAKNYKTIKEFKKDYPNEYMACQQFGWLNTTLKHFKRAIEHGKITEDYIYKIAKKYKNRTIFTKEQPGAAEKARKMGIYEEITSHMIKLIEHNKWTKNLILKESKKYKTITEWRKNSGGSYSAAKRMKIKPKHFRPLHRFFKNLKTEEIYQNQRQICIKYNINPSTLNFCLNGKCKTAGGYRWAYCDEKGNIIKE